MGCWNSGIMEKWAFDFEVITLLHYSFEQTKLHHSMGWANSEDRSPKSFLIIHRENDIKYLPWQS
jgi:hypothetical protein